METHIFRHDFSLGSEAADNDKVSLWSLASCMEAAAHGHTVELKITREDMMEMNLTWVLARISIQIDRFPQIDEPFSMETWAAGADKLYAYREFRILDAEDRYMGSAMSNWIVMDLTTRSLARMPENIQALEPPAGMPASKTKVRKIETLMCVDKEDAFRVTEEDLDVNNHVNNTNYMRWALTCAPDELRKDFEVEEMDFMYLNEVMYGDVVVCRTGCSKQHHKRPEYLHKLIRQSDGKEVGRAKTIWRPKQ